MRDSPAGRPSQEMMRGWTFIGGAKLRGMHKVGHTGCLMASRGVRPRVYLVPDQITCAMGLHLTSPPAYPWQAKAVRPSGQELGFGVSRGCRPSPERDREETLR